MTSKGIPIKAVKSVEMDAEKTLDTTENSKKRRAPTTTTTSSSSPAKRVAKTATTQGSKKKSSASEQQQPEFQDDGKVRCSWAANPKYPLLQQYHDHEWCTQGGFDRSNRHLFEMLILEGAQAGLSWSTILHKREAYRRSYDQFDYHLIANQYTSPESTNRLLDPESGIVRNRLKIEASMTNARAFVTLLKEFSPDQMALEDTNGFWTFLQQYKKEISPATKKRVQAHIDGKAKGPLEFQTTSAESDRLSADLKKRGFKFVGSTIMFSYMQAVGLEMDEYHHFPSCFLHPLNNKTLD
ncbi:hypothetical protein BGW38_005221 [Lunasporangiospora selenospora]|uniref:DNA-3-methyladenine glycosylase I n=1 Tax=Lunasporangiospora selenospora TaxID=979761 RepID=A0A9P6FQ85_9FUNG|nr:hypothetical protein BGW38_005221 [Lunasporangiospora selenospora]